MTDNAKIARLQQMIASVEEVIKTEVKTIAGLKKHLTKDLKNIDRHSTVESINFSRKMILSNIGMREKWKKQLQIEKEKQHTNETH